MNPRGPACARLGWRLGGGLVPAADTPGPVLTAAPSLFLAQTRWPEKGVRALDGRLRRPRCCQQDRHHLIALLVRRLRAAAGSCVATGWPRGRALGLGYTASAVSDSSWKGGGFWLARGWCRRRRALVGRKKRRAWCPGGRGSLLAARACGGLDASHCCMVGLAL